MEQQQEFTTSPLMQSIEAQLPKINFYRFCQLLEQLTSTELQLGSGESPLNDVIRFGPSVDVSFPAGELKNIEREPYLKRPTTVRTRFLGLYGVDAILPPSLLDDIIKRKEGYEAMTDFLDIFNHRITTQFYRIWLKYHYPASFLSGGRDPTSQSLLGLAGLGISGASEQIGTPVSRFLALLGLVTQHTRTAEGVIGVVKVLVGECEVEVKEFYPVWVNLAPTTLGSQQAILNSNVVLGRRFRESNQTILVKIWPQKESQIAQLLPDGQLHHDVMTLLRAYLGYRVDAELRLQVFPRFLPRTQLLSQGARLGQTASLIRQNRPLTNEVSVNIGRYCGLSD